MLLHNNGMPAGSFSHFGTIAPGYAAKHSAGGGHLLARSAEVPARNWHEPAALRPGRGRSLPDLLASQPPRGGHPSRAELPAPVHSRHDSGGNHPGDHRADPGGCRPALRHDESACHMVVSSLYTIVSMYSTHPIASYPRAILPPAADHMPAANASPGINGRFQPAEQTGWGLPPRCLLASGCVMSDSFVPGLHNKRPPVYGLLPGQLPAPQDCPL